MHRILSRVGPENADKARPIGSYVPYAGKNPWVWIIEPDMSRGRFISDISDKGVYNDNDMWEDISILEKIYKPYDKFWDSDIKRWFKESKNNSPGGLMWNVTRSIALYIHPRSANSENKVPVSWNTILRNDLGYVGIADLGQGVIHPNEPVQAVFFSRRSINIIEKIENISVGTTGSEDSEGSEGAADKAYENTARKKIKADLLIYLQVIKDLEYSKLNKSDKDYVEYYFDYYIGETNPDDIAYIDLEIINDELLEMIDNMMMENIDSYSNDYMYGSDNPEEFIDSEPEDEEEDEDGDLVPTWSEEQKEEAGQIAEQQAMDEAFTEIKNDILSMSPYQIKQSYSTEVLNLFTDFSNADIHWLMTEWFNNVMDDGDWDNFVEYSYAYFDPEDHINFIDSVLFKGKK